MKKKKIISECWSAALKYHHNNEKRSAAIIKKLKEEFPDMLQDIDRIFNNDKNIIYNYNHLF